MPEGSTTALAVAKFVHPVVLGVFAFVAIGVVAYQLLKPNKEKKVAYSSDRSTRHHESNYHYDPETKSVTDSAPPISNAAGNNLRKRQVAGNSSSTTKKNQSEVPCYKKSNLTVDGNKVLPEKDLGILVGVDEIVNEYFRRNTSETDSTESNLSNARRVECWECELHSAEDLDGTLSPSSISSSWSNISFEKSPGVSRRDYVDEMCRALNEDLNDLNNAEASRSASVYSVASIESESSIGTLLSGNSEMCRGCEENPVNTYNQPCNHSYMCSDCAMRIFRLFKKCKVCRAKIERIVVAE